VSERQYEFRVLGRLSEKTRQAFADMDVTALVHVLPHGLAPLPFVLPLLAAAGLAAAATPRPAVRRTDVAWAAAALALWLVVAALVLWIDSATGHRVVRLSSEPGTRSLYFHQNSLTPDGRFVIVEGSLGLVRFIVVCRAMMPAWLKTLNTSARSCTERLPPSLIVRAMAMSVLLMKQPRRYPLPDSRPSLPTI